MLPKSPPVAAGAEVVAVEFPNSPPLAGFAVLPNMPPEAGVWAGFELLRVRLSARIGVEQCDALKNNEEAWHRVRWKLTKVNWRYLCLLLDLQDH